MADSLVASDMNYTVVINGFVWVGCVAYYFLFARRWYTGPRMTVDEASSAGSTNGVYVAQLSAAPTFSGKAE
jgi:hypothetical protein